MRGAARRYAPTYLLRVPTKRGDVLLHPRDCGKLVLETEVQGTKLPRLCSLREPERPKAVVDTDVDDRCFLVAKMSAF